MSELVQVPADHIRDKGAFVDGGRKYEVITPELRPEQIVALAEAGRKPGWFVYRVNQELAIDDIPVEDAPIEGGQKSPGARLRAVLYRVWEQTTDQSQDFNTAWYPRVMEQLITKYKEKLNE